MNIRGIFYLVLVVSALVLFAGCTGPQPAVTPSPVTTTQVVSATAVPTIVGKPVTTVATPEQADGTRQLLVNKPWKIKDWRPYPGMLGQNASERVFIADYARRANDTFTWYDNGTLAYRFPNGTAYTTGTWSLIKNNSVLVEKYITSDGFYPESENEILNLTESSFVIRYPTVVAGKEYFIIEIQGLQTRHSGLYDGDGTHIIRVPANTTCSFFLWAGPGPEGEVVTIPKSPPGKRPGTDQFPVFPKPVEVRFVPVKTMKKTLVSDILGNMSGLMTASGNCRLDGIRPHPWFFAPLLWKNGLVT
jgi:hypothetical protein